MGVHEYSEEELSTPVLPPLEELERRKRDEPEESPDDILARVARLFDVEPCEIRSGSVDRVHVKARHTLWRELRRRSWSYSAIGRFTGHDHTTVLYATKGIVKSRPGLRSHPK